MPTRPVIGIATQTVEAVPGESPRSWVMGQKYVTALTERGAIPWIIPLIRDDEGTLLGIYERLDGIFLMGGLDIHPQSYGEEPEHAGRADPERDWTELSLVRRAMAEGKPVLGVCRGLQVINVAAGGTLFQDIATQRPDSIKHDYFPSPSEPARDRLVHDVRVDPGSALAEILGGETFPVNSMHHQAVKELGRGLHASAWAPDGLVEGIGGDAAGYLVGVQWHPEELTRDPLMVRLFHSFIEAARRS